MGFGNYLKDLLRPLGLYDLETGPGSAELEALGAGMDGVFARLTEAERESVLSTAEGEGLNRFRELMPDVPWSGNVEDWKQAVKLLLRVDDASFTLCALQSAISGCGITAHVEESETAQTVEVSFPGVMGEPKGFAVIQKRVEEILPCHLDIVYALRYITWAEVEQYALTWQKIQSAVLTWTKLECYREEV